tara:strand:- start:457 stop:1224 length:768 start_codon:yes stop_codon:yes gene_type:complete
LNRDLIIITGAGQGIGKNIALNIDENYDLFLISKTNNCKFVADSIKKKSKDSKRKINYKVINFENKIDFKKILKKHKVLKYNNIHTILCAAMIEDNVNSYLNEINWVKLFRVNFLANINLINSIYNSKKKSKKLNKIIVFSGGGATNSFKEFPIYSITKTATVRMVENYSEIFSRKKISIFAVAPGAVNTKMLQKVLKVTKVGTKSKMNDVIKFIKFSLKINTSMFNGRLINIKDNISKISKNKNPNYLKLRRVE